MCLVHQYFWYYGNWVSLNCHYFYFYFWHTFTGCFPMQFASNFLHDCQQYKDSKCTITFAFLSEIHEMHFTSLQGSSISNQGLEEVKYSGKCSCFPSSCQICSIPLLVLLQDAFPEENSPVSVAGRENCSLRDEEVKGGQNRIQAMTSLTGPSSTALSHESTARSDSNKSYW